MALIVEVISYKGVPPANPLSARFDHSGGSIGRSIDNQLSLPDQDKLISRRHGEIRCQGGAYSYTDASTGGTLLCDANRLLENGESVALADGDRLKIGEYELHIRIESEAQAFPGLFSSLEEPHAFAGQGASNSGFDLGISPLFEASDPLPGLGLTTPPPPAPGQPDSFINQPGVSPFQQHFTPPGIQQIPDDFSFDAILRDGQAPAPVALGKPDDFGFPDDWFGDLGTGGGHSGSPPLAQPDLSAAAPPVPVTASDGLLPTIPPKETEGIGENDFFGDLGIAPVPAGQGAEVQTAVAGGFDQVDQTISMTGKASVGKDGLGAFGTPLGPEPQVETPPSVINIPKPGQAIPAPRGAVATPPPAAVPPVAQPPVNVPPPVIVPPTVVGSGLDLFQCFLDGAGLAEFPKMTAEEQAGAMKALGSVYRDMVDGMMMVLRARSEEKREIRTDVTVIRKEKNNPLKFIPTVDDAMKVMISGKYTGYIDGTVAIREGFADIMKHQMAMRAGLQAAVGEVLKGFEPAAFEKPFEEGIVFQKKAKCWDAYCKAYPKLAVESMDNLFGDSFAKAYEEQMRMLRDMRDNS